MIAPGKTYAGRSVTPREEPIVYACACGERYAAKVWRAISGEDDALRKRLLDGDLNRVRCPRCEAPADVQVGVLFHDPRGPQGSGLDLFHRRGPGHDREQVAVLDEALGRRQRGGFEDYVEPALAPYKEQLGNVKAAELSV